MTHGSPTVYASVASPLEPRTAKSDMIVTLLSDLNAACTVTSEPFAAVTSEMITAISYLTATESIAAA
jgi:hypothetical protein